MPSYNRVRVKDEQSSGLTYSWIDYNPNGTVYSTNGPVLANFKTGRKTVVYDCVTPNYAAKRKRGEVVLNDCLRTTEDNSGSSQFLSFGNHPDWGTRQISGYWVAANRNMAVMPDWFAADIEATKPIVLLKAHAKMNEADWLSLASVAELGKTASMLAGPLHAFYGLTVTYRDRLKDIRRFSKQLLSTRGREKFLKKDLKRIHGMFGQAWLQYRYGWQPLMHDIEDITKAYKHVMDHQKSPPLLVKRSMQPLEYSYKGSVTGGSLATGNFEYEHRWDVKVSAGVIYKINDALLHSQARHYAGLDMRGFVLTAWELIPYSFVVDWFLGVGDWLNATLPNPHVTVVGNWVTTKIARISTNNCTNTWVIPGNPTIRYDQGGGTCKETYLSTLREVALPLPVLPQLTTRSLGTLRQLDSLELILQKIRKLK